MAPFRNILVPLDGSELAEKALLPAAQLAGVMAQQVGPEELPVKLTLLRVASSLPLMAADPVLYEEMIRMGIEEAQSYLNMTAESVSAGDAVVETKVASGSPADAIVYFVEENDVDLIVMSSHGRTGSKRWVYGSVAEKVMHHAPCATVIIRAHVSVQMFQNQKILVPLDGSVLAERALEPALALAANLKSDIFLIRVVPSHAPIVPDFLSPSGERVSTAISEVADLERMEAEAYLQRIYVTHDNGRMFFDVKSSDDDVADVIVSYAEEQNVDLIIISSHGRSGIGRWLHGSVAEKVLRGANCATMIIRDTQN